MDVINHLLPAVESASPSPANRNQIFWFPEKEISVESFVVGALEASFHQMVSPNMANDDNRPLNVIFRK